MAGVKELGPHFVGCRCNIADKHQSPCNGSTTRPSSLHVTSKSVAVTGSGKQASGTRRGGLGSVMWTSNDKLASTAFSTLKRTRIRRGPTFPTDQRNSPQNEDHATLTCPWKRAIKLLSNGCLVDSDLLLIWNYEPKIYNLIYRVLTEKFSDSGDIFKKRNFCSGVICLWLIKGV
jgi:hypothetical protein